MHTHAPTEKLILDLRHVINTATNRPHRICSAAALFPFPSAGGRPTSLSILDEIERADGEKRVERNFRCSRTNRALGTRAAPDVRDVSPTVLFEIHMTGVYSVHVGDPSPCPRLTLTEGGRE